MPSAKKAQTIYVAMLRGINVGGKKKVPMKELRDLVTAAGCEQVVTYIQTGNAIFTSSAAATEVATDLEARIKKVFGFEVVVVVRTAAQLEAVLKANPFGGGVEGTKLVVAFLRDKPKPNALKGIDASIYEPERFKLKGSELYLHLPNGQGQMKLKYSMFDKVLATPSTVRNWNTVTKVVELTREVIR